MNKDDAISIMIRHFQFRSDGLIGTYRLLKPGAFKGDCDDFAITLAHLVAGSVPKLIWGLLTGQIRLALWRHEITGTQHVSLEFDGAMACCITQTWHLGPKLHAYGYRRVKTIPKRKVLPKFISGLLKI